MTKVRVLKDDSGDVYVNRVDILNFVKGHLDLQVKVGQAGLNPPFLNNIAVQAMTVMAENIREILQQEKAHIAPTTIDDVPDTIPDSWIPPNGASEST